MQIKNKETGKIYTIEEITKYKLTSEDKQEVILISKEELKDYSKLDVKDSDIIIYTDGAYKPSIDQGGWAYVVMENNKEIDNDFGGMKNTTNNKMEISGVIYALSWIDMHPEVKGNIKIITDSQYVFGTITKGWKRNKNLDLWNKIDKSLNELKYRNISFEWTKGHDGNIGNNRADELAVRGSKLFIV